MDKVDDTAAHLASGLDTVEPDACSFLVVVVDLHAEGWETRSRVALWDMIPSLLVLLNAHLALDSSNELAVVGYNGLGTELLYSTADPRPASAERVLQGTMIPQFHSVDGAVLAALRSMVTRAAHNTASTSVAGALSLGLAYLNSKLRGGSMRGHMLVVSAEADNVGDKYIPAMNSIFSAQKLRVNIDVANFGHSKSFLQQAADFTGGSYLDLADAGGLVQTFLSVFAVEPSVRQYLHLPTDPDVNFSAVCFISKKVVEIGYVCSVCLCIMEDVPGSGACPVCRTKYEREATHV